MKHFIMIMFSSISPSCSHFIFLLIIFLCDFYCLMFPFLNQIQFQKRKRQRSQRGVVPRDPGQSVQKLGRPAARSPSLGPLTLLVQAAESIRQLVKIRAAIRQARGRKTRKDPPAMLLRGSLHFSVNPSRTSWTSIWISLPVRIHSRSCTLR